MGVEKRRGSDGEGQVEVGCIITTTAITIRNRKSESD